MKTKYFIFLCGTLLIALIGVYFLPYSRNKEQTTVSVNKVSTLQPTLSVPQDNTIQVKAPATQAIPIVNYPSKTISVLAQTHKRKKTLPPKPVISGPSCISKDYVGTALTIAGGNVNPPVTAADISIDPTFVSFYRKDMTGSISVAGLLGFLLYPEEKEPLVLQPDTTYYIRFFNGLENTDGFGPVATFIFNHCETLK